MIAKDIRESALYKEAEALYATLRRPGTGQITDAAEVHVVADGTHAVFTGTLAEKLEGTAPTRICEIDLRSANTHVLTFGPHTDRLPKYSPDGRSIAFLSDRHKAGDFQLYLLDRVSGAARAAPFVEGWVEYLHWSPDGRRVLLGVAGHGAELSGGQGATTSKQVSEPLPSWMPSVETGKEEYRWRRAWMYDLAENRVGPITRPDLNIWEAVWCGTEAIAAIASPGPAEGLWYSACLHLVEIETGSSRVLYRPQSQLGWPAASVSGRHLAVVEAICSDRWIVAGELLLIESATGSVQRVNTRGVDITCTEWRSEGHLLLAGHRGFETVIGFCDAASAKFTELWASSELTTGGFTVSVSGVGESGDCVLIGESFVRSPEIALIRHGHYQPVKSVDTGYAQEAKVIASVERVSWSAPDGLEIQGWLLRPSDTGPRPLIMHVHGGPVALWRPLWLGRRAASVLMLLRRGYAIFFPNPRGSSGRGQEFARQVLGEMGGADTFDYLSGVDHLIARGIADPARLGVTGGSYGGYMSAWLITQDTRFAAAVAVAPVTNFVTAHLLSNIPQFVTEFLADSYVNAGGKYYQRSPVMHAHKVKTPTLNICGALDRCTPAAEALQFHRALLENGVESVLVTYPEEGHGVRRLPAAIDYAARVVAWFEKQLPPRLG